MTAAEEESEERWAREEFGESKLKDPRQIRRLEKIAGDFMKRPQGSINAASGDRAASKAAYRFFASEIAADAILSGHRQKTMERMQERAVVLAVQDTTALNFSSQRAKQGLGSIGTRCGGAQGFFCHATLAIDAQGGALGVLDVQSYVRAPQPVKRRRTGQAMEGENARWLQSLARCQEAAQRCGSATQIISVADREADFYELFAYAAQKAPAVAVLVRAQYDRELAAGRLFAQVRAQPLLGSLPIAVPCAAGQGGRRMVPLEIRSKAVRLPAPAHWQDAGKQPVLELWMVEAWEAAPPAGETPICWRLLTTLPAELLSEALTVLGYYTLRWKIEVWHKILKSGCQIENRQLETYERLERVLRVDAIIAWRVLYLMTQGRTQTQLPCTVVLEDYQWKALYAFTKKAPPPSGQAPPLGEVMLAVARLGGFLARKGDGYPGPQVLWHGLAKLDTIAQAWLAFSPPNTCG